MKLLGKKVLIRKDAEKETSAGGIILTSSNQSNSPSTGTIVNTSAGYPAECGQVEITLREGQRVAFFKSLAMEVVIDNEKLFLIDCDNILGYYE